MTEIQLNSGIGCVLLTGRWQYDTWAVVDGVSAFVHTFYSVPSRGGVHGQRDSDRKDMFLRYLGHTRSLEDR